MPVPKDRITSKTTFKYQVIYAAVKYREFSIL